MSNQKNKQQPAKVLNSSVPSSEDKKTDPKFIVVSRFTTIAGTPSVPGKSISGDSKYLYYLLSHRLIKRL